MHIKHRFNNATKTIKNKKNTHRHNKKKTLNQSKTIYGALLTASNPKVATNRSLRRIQSYIKFLLLSYGNFRRLASCNCKLLMCCL